MSYIVWDSTNEYILLIYFIVSLNYKTDVRHNVFYTRVIWKVVLIAVWSISINKWFYTESKHLKLSEGYIMCQQCTGTKGFYFPDDPIELPSPLWGGWVLHLGTMFLDLIQNVCVFYPYWIICWQCLRQSSTSTWTLSRSTLMFLRCCGSTPSPLVSRNHCSMLLPLVQIPPPFHISMLK